jgi:hypothetical protein
MDYWFNPDLNSDLNAVAAYDGRWRFKTAVFQLYVQQVNADTINQFGVGPNYYPNLVSGGFFSNIRLPLAAEAGIIKDWSWDGKAALDAILQAIQRTKDTGHPLTFIGFDEPLTALKNAGKPFSGASTIVSNAITQIKAAGVPQVGLVEAFPWLRPHDILPFMDEVAALGTPFNFLHLDVDHRVFDNYSLWKRFTQWPKDVADMTLIRDTCRLHGIPLGVIATPNMDKGSDAATFCTTAKTWVDSLPRAFGGWPDRLLVQSWQQKDLPPAIPETTPNTLSHLLLSV